MNARHPLGRAIVAAIVLLMAVPLFAAERQRLRVDSYLIDADIIPARHVLVARALVKFTAIDDLPVATFELHNALKVKRVIDEAGHQLSAERVTQDNTVRVSLPQALTKGQSSTLIFDYEGPLANADDSPVQGLKLASIGNDNATLLYAGRWFPVSAYGTDRFTATINVGVPATWVAIGSGNETIGSPVRMEVPLAAAATPEPAPEPATKSKSRRPVRGHRPVVARTPALTNFTFSQGDKIFTYVWDKPSFPGTIIAGPYTVTKFNNAGADLRVYFRPTHQQFAASYGEWAAKEFTYFSSLYGSALSPRLNIVEIPDDTLPSAWAPEIAALATSNVQAKPAYRLLANSIAHQWWGVAVSPKTRDDWWIADGFARYSDALFVESVAGRAGLDEAVKDMAVGALAYDSVPLARVSTLDTFSPEFQTQVTEKGGIILNMLRWVMGDANFERAIKTFYLSYGGKPATVQDFQNVVSQVEGQNLSWFFAQWLDSTGAPEFKNKYTVYRTAKGFRVVGEISQDLDLFRMPVELKIDTDGKTETKRIEVVGTNSAYSVETFGRPRRISIDPNNMVLQNSPDLKLQTSIRRGRELQSQGDLTGALREFQKALDSNHNSSLGHFRIAEVFFLQRNFQAAANAYRESLNGDGEPKWTEVWSHLQLGKIFDLTGQRERAVNEYRQAVNTNDNTQGALEEARKYLQSPYQRENAKAGD